MVKVRIKFKRGEELRFLSHLDQQRLFQRAMRRSGMPLAFSQGYNPHPILAFGNAMSVGMISDEEYADIGIDMEPEHFDSALYLERLNLAMPTGIIVESMTELEPGTKSLTRMIQWADYDVSCRGLRVSDFSSLSDELGSFNELDEVQIEKRNKRGATVVKNIRANFQNLTAELSGDAIVFSVRILTVDGSLLKPETVVEAFLHSIGYYNESVNMLSHRRTLHLEGQEEHA